MAKLICCIYSALLFCAFCVGGCNGVPDKSAKNTKTTGGIVLSIDFNKKEYVMGEPVVAEVSVRNTGNVPIYANWFSLDGDFTLKLENMDGTRIHTRHFFWSVSKPLSRFEESLNPGEIYTTAMDITRAICGSSELCPSLARHQYPATKISGYVVGSGTFKLKAIHALNYRRNPAGSAKGIYASTTFTIRKPNHTEKTALKLFETQPFFASEDAEESRKTNAEQSQLESIAAFDKIWNNYRDTVYAPYALYYAARVSQKMGDNSEAIRKYETLESSSKDFPLIADLLYYKTIALKDSGKKDKALIVGQQLKDKYWDHLVAPTIATQRNGSSLRNLVSNLGIK